MSQAAFSEQDFTRLIDQMQQAQAQLRSCENELMQLAEEHRAQALPLLRKAVAAGLALEDEEKASNMLLPLTALLEGLEGPEVCEMLVDLAGCEDVEVRAAASGALEGLAEVRFREVADAIERAPQRMDPESPALCELPWVLAETSEGSVIRSLRPYFAHRNAEVVANAIEVVAMTGDRAAAPDLRKLLRDPRTVELEAEGTHEQVALGTLALEALEHLGEDPNDKPAKPAAQPGGGNKKSGRRR